MDEIHRSGQIEESQMEKTGDFGRAEKETDAEDNHSKKEFDDISCRARSPLAIITGSSLVLLEEMSGGLNEQQREHIKRILESGKALQAIFAELERKTGC